MGNPKIVPGLILAAGGVVERHGHILIVHHARRQEWTLPRGKLKVGESPLEAALREVREETGYTVRAESFLGSVSYLVNDVPKVALYWTMTALGGPGKIDAKEIGEARWFPMEHALGLLNHAGERGLLRARTGE